MYALSPITDTCVARTLNREPALDDMLADPVMQLLMRSDRVHASDIRRVLQQVKRPRGFAADPVAPAMCCAGAAGG